MQFAREGKKITLTLLNDSFLEYFFHTRDHRKRKYNDLFKVWYYQQPMNRWR